MKAKKVITTCGIILGGLAMAGGASALSYVDDSQIQFTFNSMLTMSLSSGDLTITDLAPGNSANSAPVTITVNTNSQYGYGLYATVGNTTYNNTNLNGTTGATFTSVATNANTTSLSGGYWGYSIDTGAHYNGLPLYTATNGAELKTTTGAAANDTTSFLIGAAADTAQTQDTYNNVINFSAVAKVAESLPLIQDLDASLCVANAPTVVTDSRDEQSYTVQRLADGKCWMMTNLNLGATDLTTDLTSDNTNLTDTVSAATFNGWKKSSSSGSFTVAEYIPVSGADSTNDMPYGTLYNYCAASAGTYCYASGSGTGDATSDLCPKGWRLPTGNTSGEFQTLYSNSSYNTYAKMRNPVASGGAAFTLSGTFLGGSPSNPGSYGAFWSSTRFNGNFMYYLSLDGSSVNPASIDSRNNGFSVRCVLQSDWEKDPLTALENGTAYLQDFASLSNTDNTNLLNSMEAGKSYTVKDKRDEQTYTIAKINGNLWMTRNLAIGCNGSGSTYGDTIKTITLTSSDSNVSSDWTTPTALLSTAANSSSTSGYDTAAMQCTNANDDPNNEYGAWYNYAAASAGTITGSSNSNTQTYDVCPKGWRLPTQNEFSGITGYSSAFSPVKSGYYDSGFLYDAGLFGRWWSATVFDYDSDYRYYLEYFSSLDASSGFNRVYGCSVRCVRG